MQGVPGLGMFELLLTTMFYSGLGFPLGIPPAEPDNTLLQMAPNESVFYSTWSGTTEPKADGSNETELLLAEPEVQTFIREVSERFRQAMDEAAAAANSERDRLLAEWAREALPLLVTHQGSVYVSRVTVGPDGPTDVAAGMIVYLGDRVDWARQSSRRLRETLLTGRTTVGRSGDTAVFTLPIGGPVEKVSWAVWHGYLIVGVGSESVGDVIARAKTPVPEWLQKVRQDLSVPRVSLTGYLNLQRLLETVQQHAPAEARELMQQLDLQHFRHLGAVSGLDEQGYVSRSKLYTDGTMPRLLDSLMAGGLTAEQLVTVPSDANFVATTSVDLPKTLDTLIDLAKRMSPPVAEQIEMAITQIGQVLNADVRRDVLASIGKTWTVYSSPSEGGTFLTGLTAVLEIDDDARFAPVYHHAIRMLTAVPQSSRRLLTSEANGTTVYTLSGLGHGIPVAPSWCLADGRLWIALQPQSLRAAMQRDSTFESLSSSPIVREVFQDQRNVTAFRYSDAQGFIKVFYPILPYALEGISNSLGHDRTLVDVTKLPALPAILPHMKPNVSYLVIRDDGIESVTHQTLPGSNLTAVAPVSVALLLPAVQAARSAARRAQSMNNMKQILLGVLNYERAYGRFPAAAMPTEAGKTGLSWRVAILPFVEEQALYEKFHKDEPWDSDHNQALIAEMPDVFRSPLSALNEPGKTNYLAVRGEGCVIADEEKGIQVREIRDGTSNTILAVEVNDDRAVIWTKPDDFVWKADRPQDGLGGLIPGELFIAVFVDGHIQLIPKAVRNESLRAAFTRDGGERIPEGALQEVVP